MKNEEKTILKIAENVLIELGNLSADYKISGTKFINDHIPIRGKYKGEKTAIWSVYLDDLIFDTTDFLFIMDETGEPLYAQSKHGVSEIEKVDGKYKWKKS